MLLPVITFLSLSLFGTQHVFACKNFPKGWEDPDSSTPPILLAQVISRANHELGLEISDERVRAKCADYYKVVDKSTSEYLGSIPSPNAEGTYTEDGRFLQVRLLQLLKTSRYQIVIYLA